MITQSQVVNLQGQYRIHAELLRSDNAQATLLVAKDPLSINSWLLHSLRYLYPHFNVVLFDGPHEPSSRASNPDLAPLTEHDQVDILLAMREHFACDYLLSTAGAAHISLQALALAPNAFDKAVIQSYSPRLTVEMSKYLNAQLKHLEHIDLSQFAATYHSSLGQFLPPALKLQLQQHIAQLSIAQIYPLKLLYQHMLELPEQDYPALKGRLTTPVLFINGELDAFCHPLDVQRMRLYLANCQFRQLSQTGHCLGDEQPSAWLQNRDAQLAFLLPTIGACA